MSEMTTLSEILNKLRKEGYTHDFNLKDDCIECHGSLLQVFPHEFVVDRIFRFEGQTDPSDEAIVYAISSDKHSLKGTLVNGYGIYSDKVTDDMVRALEIAEK